MSFNFNAAWLYSTLVVQLLANTSVRNVNNNDVIYEMSNSLLNLDISYLSSMISYQKMSLPLYLMVEWPNIDIDEIRNYGRMNRNVFYLEEYSQVNGDTFKFIVQSDSNSFSSQNPCQMMDKWSRIFLCASKSCANAESERRTEMKLVSKDTNRNYLHLMPSTTAVDIDMDDEMPIAHDMKEMQITENVLAIKKSVDSDSVSKYESDSDLFVIEMSSIMVCVMIFGVVYVFWRYLIEKRNNERELSAYMPMQSSTHSIST